MSGTPTFDTEKKQKRGEFITPPRPTGRRGNYKIRGNHLSIKLYTYLHEVDLQQQQTGKPAAPQHCDGNRTILQCVHSYVNCLTVSL